MTGSMVITGLETGADDDGFWNIENGGRVSIRLFSRALAAWLVLQGRDVSVAEARAAFNTTGFVIGQAASYRRSLDVRGDKLCFVLDRQKAIEAIDASMLASVVQVISFAQNDTVRLGQLSVLMMVPREMIEAAIGEHPYMSIDGDEIIHDGE
ncbi:hypothetical protein [Thalassospira lucentensis]|uniref:hypothetical protein n=1 Tax=Thalassospira lucentensis TaxID=168935 RepID=UPI002943374B|nr:hypothetical protein [Thalassospira lucentensis]WOI09001.1 hypothetical protein R1T41_00810 [Thalassospira lucentensis]